MAKTAVHRVNDFKDALSLGASYLTLPKTHPLGWQPQIPKCPVSTLWQGWVQHHQGRGDGGEEEQVGGEGWGWVEGIELNRCFLLRGFPTPKWSLINLPDQITPPWEEKKCVFSLGHKTSILTSHR